LPGDHIIPNNLTMPLAALAHLPEQRAFQEQAVDLRFDLCGARSVLGQNERLSGILRSAKLLYYQILISTYRHANILRSESSGAPDL